VVLICRNKAQSLPYVIAALARNTQRPDLVALSDDASTDRSPEIFAELCIHYNLPWKTVLHSHDGSGFRLNTLRNDGIEVCEDGLVIILDADHVPARTHIEAHLELHSKYERGVLSTGPRLEYAYPDCSGPISFMWGHEPVSMLQASAIEPVPTWAAVLASNLGMTKQAIVQLGGFDPIYDGNYGFDDVDFTYRAWKAEIFFAASFEAYVVHIPHPAFHNRSGDINRQRFKQKFNIDLSYPKSIRSMSRRPWHEYYQALCKPDDSEARLSPPFSARQQIVVEMLALETIHSKILLRVVLSRILRRIYRTLGLR